ncbi:extracellular matrix regulator RemB [Allobacillus sp. GCM10007491]|uniref:DUF370 domain-containing protein n=1 Tax=Allobacillus saliphilus TaxID=2912308 RepID=A0A941CVF9_9BACI|nr:DUF370 domain-containing protein [Allobacillus saliphilus]MBR7554717.1 DUF370 domain-containing protein [Allobacillus saliphilus]
MFVHIGDDNVIRTEEVIAMVDYSLFSSSTIIEEMIYNQRKENNVTDSAYDEAKSIVITVDHIYFSSLSVSTLSKRAQIADFLDSVDDVMEDSD